MSEFPLHTIDSAPETSKPILEGTLKNIGFVPNLLAKMAESPALLEGYTTLSGIFDKSDLSATERQIILMTNNRLNQCTYCMAAHTSISKGQKVPDDVILSLRQGTPIADPKLEALRAFTEVIVKSRGWPGQGDVDAFLSAGYTKQTILEVILGTSLKVMSNYANHIAKTPVDDAFASNVWTAPANSAAE